MSIPADVAPLVSLQPDEGEKTVVMRIPYSLWKWASREARQEGSNLTQRTIALYQRWRAEKTEAVLAAASRAKPKRAKAKKTRRSKPNDKTGAP